MSLKKIILFILIISSIILSIEKGSSNIGNEVLVKIKNNVVTIDDFKEALRNVRYTKNDDVKKVRQNAIKTLINRAILLDKAEDIGLEKNEIVQKSIKKSKEDILLNYLIVQKFGKQLSITDTDIRTFYFRNQNMFRNAEKREVYYITTTNATQAIQVIQYSIKEKNFQKAIEKFGKSDNLTDYYLGYVKKSQLIPQIRDEIFATKTNNLSRPIKYQNGYIVAFIANVQPASMNRLGDVYTDIRDYLLTQKRDALVADWIEELKLQSNITINGEKIKKLINNKSSLIK